MASVHPNYNKVRLWDKEKWCATMKSKKKEKVNRKRKLSMSNDSGDGKCKEVMQQSDGGATPDRSDNDGGLKSPPWLCTICKQTVPSQE
jgi:hypothetical protein